MSKIIKYPHIIREAKYGRVYEVAPDVYFPSVTTVLRYSTPTPEFLLKWQIEKSNGDYNRHLNHSGEASEIGTAVHSLIERLLAGEEITITDNPKDFVPGKGYYPTYETTTAIRKGLQSFLAFWDHCNPKIESTEQLLFSIEKDKDEYLYPFCGRCDIVAVINGERWMLDVKTSKYAKGVFNYKCQLSMYRLLHDAMFPDKPIDRMGVIWCKKDFLNANPPKSVLEPIEYEYKPELIHHLYTIFREVYDGYALGYKPKTRAKAPKVFSLEGVK